MSATAAHRPLFRSLAAVMVTSLLIVFTPPPGRAGATSDAGGSTSAPADESGASGKAYVTDRASGILVIAAATEEVLATVPVASNAVDVTVAPDGERAYALSFTDTTLSVIDAATDAVTATVPGSGTGQAIAASPDGRRVYLLSTGPGTLTALDTATNAAVGHVGVPEGGQDLALNPAGTRAYVSNNSSDDVTVIDTATMTVVARIASRDGSSSEGLVVSPDGTRLYVAYQGGFVAVVNTETNVVIDTITIPATFGLYSVALNPTGTRLYVGSLAFGTVTVIDAATGTVVATVPDVPKPSGLAVRPDGTDVWAVGQNDNRVRVIDTGTNAIASTFAAGESLHFAIAFGPALPAGTADVSVNVTDSADPVPLGGPSYTYTVLVTNHGPDVATGARVSVTLSGAARTINSATTKDGSCALRPPTVSCALDDLADDGTATIVITVTPSATGVITATAAATSTATDPVGANNTDVEVTTVDNALGCTIIGTPGNDVLNGGSGDDVICGLGGDDTINAGAGNDAVYGGAGNDTVDAGAGNDAISGGSGRDRLTGDTGNDTIDAGSGFDPVVNGGDGNDYLDVRDGHPFETAVGGAGRDTCVVDTFFVIRLDLTRSCELTSPGSEATSPARSH